MKKILCNNKVMAGNLVISVSLPSHPITPTLTHVTADPSNPTKIVEGDTTTLIFYSDEGYTLPASVSVTGATVSSWTTQPYVTTSAIAGEAIAGDTIVGEE